MTNIQPSLWNRITAPWHKTVAFAKTAVMSLSTAIHIKRANGWRDQFNPLRGLTMARAVMHLEEGERGAYADLQWLYRYIEKRDATLRGGKRSLLSAVTEMDWDIKTVDEERLPRGYTAAQAEAQAVTLRTAYDAIRNLPVALEFLGLAEFRGFAHLEKVRDSNGQVVLLNPVEQWYWCRDGINGQWMYNADARPGRNKGEDVDLTRFILREIDDPINEIALLAYVRKMLGRKDEDGYIESFGIPSIFAIMPSNVPQGRETEYQALAEQVISDSRGALPNGADIKTVDAGARGVAPFRDYQEALDKEIVMAITSGQLTMLAESGSGTLAGKAHTETFQRVARALAKRITAALQAQFDLEILGQYHPGQPPLAYFEILTNEETDVGEVVKDVRGLRAAGYRVKQDWLEEKTGYPLDLLPVATRTPGVPALPAVDPLGNRSTQTERGAEAHDVDDDFLSEALELMSASMQKDFKPVAERLQAILAKDLDDEALRAALEQLQADLPALAAEVAASEETVQAWAEILGAAMANEFEEEES